MRSFIQSPLSVAAISAVVGAIVTALMAHLWNDVFAKPAKSIRAEYCAGEPTTPYMIDAAGQAWDISKDMGSYPITHVITVQNDGVETIDNQELNISFFPRKWENQILLGKPISDGSFYLLELMVLFESSYANHELSMDRRRPAQKILLKNFNPGDTIAIVAESAQELQANVGAKGPGLTLSQHFTSGCTVGNYGGSVAFRELAPDCSPAPLPELGLFCKFNGTVERPEGSAEGPFSIEWRRR